MKLKTTKSRLSYRWIRGGIVALTVALVGLGIAIFAILNARPSIDTQSPAVMYAARAQEGPAVSATFFGTSTILLSDGQSALMTDAFFSRPSFFSLAMKIRPDPDEISFALKKAPNKIDAIFVAHSHHDHAMDSGVVAQRVGAVIYGSESTLNVARGQGTPEKNLRVLRVGESIRVGAFEVIAFQTPHSPDPISPGLITHPLRTPAKLTDYGVGENFSFFVKHPVGRILIVPSANYLPGAFASLQADIVLLGVGTLGKQSSTFTETYWSEVVKATGAKLVIPIHWDDFTKTLREPLVPLPFFMDDMSTAMTRLYQLAARDGVEIRFLPALREVVIRAGS